ncbi:hypothetical protein QZH41_019330 [Actinostola sp. cb2023]|nr:hypothetical protein QZH41_019330 [Actinostola sp. cb2023]
MQRDGLTACAWKDKKLVYFLASNCEPIGDDTVGRKKKDGTAEEFSAPPCVVFCNKYMGGVDYADQKRSDYRIPVKSRRWYRYLAFFLFETAVANAFILRNLSPNHATTTQLLFRLDLFLILLTHFLSIYRTYKFSWNGRRKSKKGYKGASNKVHTSTSRAADEVADTRGASNKVHTSTSRAADEVADARGASNKVHTSTSRAADEVADARDASNKVHTSTSRAADEVADARGGRNKVHTSTNSVAFSPANDVADTRGASNKVHTSTSRAADEVADARDASNKVHTSTSRAADEVADARGRYAMDFMTAHNIK